MMAKSDLINMLHSPDNRNKPKKSQGGGKEVTFQLDVDEETMNMMNFDHHSTNPIHSGHFMLSRVHDDTENDDSKPEAAVGELSESPTVSLVDHDPEQNQEVGGGAEQGFNFEDDAVHSPRDDYNFGDETVEHFGITTSLTKLFNCMSLAYSGKLTSPKWKNFEGIKLRLKEKIRLNNIIWREWHMQFIQGQTPIICQFEPPITDKTHTKPEAVVLEGKYWKRRLESVTSEYQKWRLFHRKKGNKDTDMIDLDNAVLLERVAQKRPAQPTVLATVEQMMEDDFVMDFTDTLFTTLNQQGFVFPNPKEMSCLGNADIIQPGLIQLQPNLEDYLMDSTLEPLPSLQEMLAMGSSPISNNFKLNSYVGSMHNSGFLDLNLGSNSPNVPSGNMEVDPINVLNPASEQTNTPSMQCGQQAGLSSTTQIGPGGIQSQSQPNEASLPPQFLKLKPVQPDTSQIINLILAQDHDHRQHGSGVPQLSNLTQASAATGCNIVTVPSGNNPLIIQSGTTIQAILQGLHVEQFPSPAPLQGQGVFPQNAQGSASAPLLQNMFTIGDDRSNARRSSTGSSKDVFAIPKNPTIRSRQRVIAPAQPHSPLTTPSNVLQEKTVLAKLLTGSYTATPPLAGIKQEAALTSHTQLQSSNITRLQMPAINAAALAIPSSSPSENFSVTNPNSVVASLLQTGNLLSSDKSASHNNPVNNISGISPVFTIGSSGKYSNGSPSSPSGSESLSVKNVAPKVKAEAERADYKETRKFSHLHSEQKRRYNIKSGFDTLHQLVPTLRQSSNMKSSLAAKLQKTADFIRIVKVESQQMREEAERLRKEIESLKTAISICQSQLPATGVPITPQRADEMRDMFEKYVQRRTLNNWRFYIFSIIITPLFESFNSMVLTSSMEDVCRTVLAWLDQHCSLPKLRPGVLESLTKFSRTTSILSDPKRVPEQATAAVTFSRQRHSSANM